MPDLQPSMSSDSEDSLLSHHMFHRKEMESNRGYPRSFMSRHRFLVASCISLFAVSLAAMMFFLFWSSSSRKIQYVPDETPIVEHTSNVTTIDVVDPLNPPAWLNGPPTASFRGENSTPELYKSKRQADNLRSDVKYITSWVSAGWTNDVMTYGNLIYLGLITDRVPIVPMFTPSHIGGNVPPIHFGDVFDVPRLSKYLEKPILEWRDVKDPGSDTLDDLGCWNIWEVSQYREAFPRRSSVPTHLKLDISYTKGPTWLKLIPNFEHDSHTTFWALATLGFPQTRQANLVTPLESPTHHVQLPPDEQLLCYDYLYYVCAHQPYEWDYDYSPAWRYVGQYMRWTKPLEDLAESYIRATIGVEDGEPTPPYIGIHVRHYDFANWCGDVPVEDCFASLPVIARRVREVKDEILARKGIAINHVIMTSDERNSTWWDQVTELGWLRVNHSRTIEAYGTWYPLLIDAVIQSGGEGFVGTDRSTMSIVARRRVESWRDGATRMVKWGRLDSDDH